MKFIYFLSMVLAVAIAQEKYDLDTMKIDIDKADKKQLHSILNCFINDGPCEGYAADLKKYVADSIETACTKCTDPHKHIANVLLKKFPELEGFEKLKALYDPNGNRLPALATAVAKY